MLCNLNQRRFTGGPVRMQGRGVFGLIGTGNPPNGQFPQMLGHAVAGMKDRLAGRLRRFIGRLGDNLGALKPLSKELKAFAFGHIARIFEPSCQLRDEIEIRTLPRLR